LTPCRMRMALKVMSSRLPIGVPCAPCTTTAPN
jgi:hypothetical protein